MKRSASEQRQADWFKAKKAVIGIMTTSMAVAVTKKGLKGSQETSIEQVDLYVVNVMTKAKVIHADNGRANTFTPEEYEKVIGAPGGSIEELLHVAMKKYPLEVKLPEKPVHATSYADEPLATNDGENPTVLEDA